MSYPISTRILLACLLVSFAAAGCTSAGGSPVLVEYHRTGGIAGFDDTVVVHENGTARVSRSGDVSVIAVSQESLAQIRAQIKSEVFLSLEQEYIPPEQGADLFTYEVTAGGKTVRAQDGAVPEALEALIGELNGIIGAAGQASE
ncbi:MAG: hypothetical protein APR53_04120 [Methanoculleus sp. SDB]|nr:MAG: hypothetical protein APR53_04120 [Methanoculleus sp. SDB]